MADRPLIAIPARFSQSASALRYRAEVAARALVSAVYVAGGEPLLMHPDAAGGRADEAEIARRLSFADGVLLPGGGDLAGCWSGQPEHPSLYDVDLEQDAFDLAMLRVAVGQGLPVLAICRGAQLLAVANGGQLVQDMAAGAGQHRHRLHEVST
ncbi:MAG: gamma-glutamyl-gamma-aminobutyrate hydrolase family protein, partial [Actinomycetota bacterium]|nr:gamma-glutamyl-gamma-aminobutyrate hydrolase family protein [Actinomycetota bacterium]